jgi:ComEC/Rec2-related protein
VSALAIGSSMLIAAIGGWPFVVLISAIAIVATRWFGRRTLLHIPLAIVAAFWVNMALPNDIDDAVADQYGWRLEVTSMPAMRAQGWSFDARVRDGAAKGERVLVYSYDDHAVALRDDIYVVGAFQPASELEASYHQYLDGRGVSGQIYASTIEIDRRGTGIFAWLNRQRQVMVGRVMNAAPGDAGSLMAGLVTGDDGKLAAATDDEFKRAGLTHITAISGANLAFAVALLVDAGKVLRRRRRTMLVAGMLLAWTYAAFVGMSPATLRAALMTTAVAGGRFAGRPFDPLTLSTIMAVAQLAVRPQDAFSVSFLLSVAASVGLSIGLGTYPASQSPAAGDWVRGAIYAQIATAVIIGATFGQFSLLSIPANIAAAPLMVVAFPASVACLALLRISETLGSAFAVPAAWPIDGLLKVGEIYGREQAMISVPTVDARLTLTGIIAVMLGLALLSGEINYLRRKARRRSPKYQLAH